MPLWQLTESYQAIDTQYLPDKLNEIYKMRKKEITQITDEEKYLHAHEPNTIDKLQCFLIEVSAQLMFLLISKDEMFKDLSNWSQDLKSCCKIIE